MIGKGNPKVKAVATFSPGKYIKGIQIAKTLNGMKKPIFFTSSKSETERLCHCYIKHVKAFKSPVKGVHGSRVLRRSAIVIKYIGKLLQIF